MKPGKPTLIIFAVVVLLAALAAGVMAIDEPGARSFAGAVLIILAGAAAVGIRQVLRAVTVEGRAPVSETPDRHFRRNVLMNVIGVGAIYGLITWTSTFSPALMAAIVVCTVFAAMLRALTV